MSLILRAINPIVWRLPGRAARKLFSFARAEQASMADMLEAARLTSSVERAALYLRHANDESRHAKLFVARSAALQIQAGKEPLGPLFADTEGLFAGLGEEAFLAFVHIGESRGLAQFESYIRYFEGTAATEDQALFVGICKDETRHKRYTRELLVELSGSEKAAAKAIRRAKRWQAWRSWRRLGRGTAGRLHLLLMLALFVAITPLALLVKLFKPNPKSWRQLP